MLYDDDDHEAADALRSSIVAKARRSPAAVAKQTRGVTPDGLPVHSFQSLLADLGSMALDKIVTPLTDVYEITACTTPTTNQRKAFQLLGINPERTQ